MILKISPHGNFRVTKIAPNLAICEAVKGDRHGWGNATDTEPAFIVYLGCEKEEIQAYIKIMNSFYRTECCEVRKPKYLKSFEKELKIRGMQRYSDANAFGLDYLVESEEAKHFGCDYDEYQYYTTGVMQRW